MRARTIRVFEHALLEVGATYTATDGTAVQFSLREFDLMVRFNDQHDGRFFDVRHRAIRLTHHVGIVQIGRLGIEIVPKADRGASTSTGTGPWHDALIWMLAETRRLRLHDSTPSSLAIRRASIFDLYVDLFLRLVERLVHQGLARRYRTVRENTTAVRGRLLINENIRHNLTHAERFFVEDQARDTSHLLNQILKAALVALQEVSGMSLASRTQPLLQTLDDVELRPIGAETFRRVLLDRMTQHYASALQLARLILLHYCPDARTGREPLIAFLFDMNELFEEFVARMLASSSIPGLSVHVQESRVFWPDAGRRSHRIRPDVVVRQSGSSKAVVLDTKWKVPVLGRPTDEDLRQMYVYNRYFGAQKAILLYPSSGAASGASSGGNFVGEQHGCSVAFLSLLSGDRFDRAQVRRQLGHIVVEALGA